MTDLEVIGRINMLDDHAQKRLEELVFLANLLRAENSFMQFNFSTGQKMWSINRLSIKARIEELVRYFDFTSEFYQQLNEQLEKAPIDETIGKPKKGGAA